MGIINNPIRMRCRGVFLVLLAAVLAASCGAGCGEKETVVDTAASNGTSQGGTLEKRICPKCGRQYFNGELFCIYDRTQLVAANTITATEKVCPVCGRKYPPSKNFCVLDGTALVDVVEDEGNAVAQAPGTSTPGDKGDDAAKQPLETRTETTSRSSDTRVASVEPVAPRTYSSSGSRYDTGSSRSTGSRSTTTTTGSQKRSTTGSTSRSTTGTSHGSTRKSTGTTYSSNSYRPPPTPRPSRYVPPPTPRPSRYVPPPTPRPSRYVPPPTPIPARPTPVPRHPTPVPPRATPVPPPPPLPVATPKPVVVAKVEPPGDSRSASVVSLKSASELFAEFETTSARASQGKLSAADVAALEAVGMSDANFTRSRALLAMNYKNRDNSKYYKALTELMSLPENQYNPMYNLELAEYYLLTKKYAKSVEQARLVDRFKQRLPRSVYYQNVARMYEVQAKAYEGRFNETEDPEYLDKAISIWNRYINHVSRKDQVDRVQMAKDYIAKLEKIKRRLE